MKFDDSQPDYFVDAPSADAPEVSDGRTISFGGDEPAGDGGAVPGKSRWRKVLMWTAVVAVAVLAVTVYFRYFSPYVTDGRMKCYVINVEKRGLLFKTYEADVVSESALTDTVRLYSRERSFSVAGEELAKRLQQEQGSGRPVVLEYETYNASVPWRGASKSVVTGAQF